MFETLISIVQDAPGMIMDRPALAVLGAGILFLVIGIAGIATRKTEA